MNQQTTIDDSQPTDVEMAAIEADWTRSTMAEMREKEIEWTQKGYCFSWIDPEPTYTPSADFWFTFCCASGDKLPNPKRPCKRIMRVSLLGGGQIRTMEHFVARQEPDAFLGPVWCRKIDLKVTAHTRDGIVTVFGHKYDGPHYEMNMHAVVLYSRNGQDIADRTAATLRLIDCLWENFLALLDGTEGCGFCGRPLKDEISKLNCVGPDCAKQYNVPHSRQAAEKRLELRKKLLGESK